MPKPSWKSTVFAREKSLYNRPTLSTQLGRLSNPRRRASMDAAALDAVLALRKTYGNDVLQVLSNVLQTMMPEVPAEESRHERESNRADRQVPEPIRDEAGNPGQA